MDHLFTKIGRLQVALDSLDVEYDKLLDVVRQLASGEIEPARVAVDLQARTWRIGPDPVVTVELPQAASTDPAPGDGSTAGEVPPGPES